MADRKPAKPPIPTWFTIVAVLLSVALIGGAFLLGYRQHLPEPEPSPTPTPPLTVPEMLGDYPMSESVLPSESPQPDQREVARATYTDGVDKLVLILARPETKLEQFMADAGVTDLQIVSEPSDEPSEEETPAEGESPLPTDGTVLCGNSVDSGFAACGRLRGNVGQIVFAGTDVDATQVEELLLSVP